MWSELGIDPLNLQERFCSEGKSYVVFADERFRQLFQSMLDAPCECRRGYLKIKKNTGILSAADYLKEKRRISDISLYGMSMGTIFAALAANYTKVTNLILCSPTHAPFEGAADKKHMSGHSVAVYGGKELPFVRPDFSRGGMSRYGYSGEAGKKVTGMWAAYNDAYRDRALEEKAALHLRETEARILFVAGTGDEMWNSAYSAKYMYGELENSDYAHDHKILLYPDASHLIGVMPNRERNKMLYRMIPLIGIFYRRFAENRKLCMEALEQSEKEIVDWILKD